MSKPKPKPRAKAKASSPSHGAGSVGGRAKAGAVDSKGGASSGVPSEAVVATQHASQWIARHQWGNHKRERGWPEHLKEAKKAWREDSQDLLIAALHKHSPCNSDEIDAAVKWECFRHLFFSGGLSDFWREMIEGDHLETLEKFHPHSLRKISVIYSHDPNDFASPWAQWANTPCFPFLPWVMAREERTFDEFRAAAASPTECAKLLTNSTDTWNLAYCWARQQIEEYAKLIAEDATLARDTYALKIHEPAEIPCTGEQPERAGNENITRLIVEIDWNLPKTAILEAFERQIEPLWQRRNPDGKNGRGDTERTFFSGLAIRRRVERDFTLYDACKGLYERRTDTKDGITLAAKNALGLADKRLAETKAALAVIEDKLKRS